jgi:hypothetical protein
MTVSLKNIGEKLFTGYLCLVCVWIVFALLFDATMLTLHFTNPDLAAKIGNEIEWKIDGTFKNNPDNIWYEEPETNKK